MTYVQKLNAAAMHMNASIDPMHRFVAGGDSPEAVARRNGAFKLIPHIVQGSWIVKQSVGETPVLLGRKLTTQYFR